MYLSFVLLVTQVVQKTVKWVQLAPSFICFYNQNSTSAADTNSE